MHIKKYIIGLTAALLGLTSTGLKASEVTLNTELGQDSYYYKESGKTFLRLDLEGIRNSEGERPPVNIAIVIDRSGSMNGEKIEQAKEAAIMAVERLGRDDLVSVITYSDTAEVLIPPTYVKSVAPFRHKIRTIRPSGRTALYAGTKRGVDEIVEYLDENKVNRVILLSDGLANIGPSRPSDLEKLGQKAAEQGISITTIGLGLGFNEDLMTRLAYASDGNHAFVRHERDLVDIFNKEFGDVLSVIAQDVEIIIDCHIGFRPIRVLGRDAEIKGQKVHLKMNQLYSAQQKQIILEVEFAATSERDEAPMADIKVDYRSLKDKKRKTVQETASLRYTKDKTAAERSLNKRVMSSVVEQIGTIRNEKAVDLRDKGKIKEAKKVLEENAAYLRQEAQGLGDQYAGALNDLAKKNKMDSENLDEGRWAASRKEMKARQYKLKTQQSY